MLKPTLLYFEEYESNLSRKIFSRNDIEFVILRTNKNMKFFTNDYLKKTQRYKVFVADYNKPIIEEVKRFKKWSTENSIQVTHFLNDSEYYLEYANIFAKHLKFGALSTEQIKWVRDKIDMKNKFREIGLDTVDFYPVDSKKDFLDLTCKKYENGMIFKPRRGMNSIDTYRIEDEQSVDDLPIEFINDKYMIEEFCTDQEWSIESIVQNGKVLDSYVTYIPNPTIWASIENKLNCHMTVPDPSKYFNVKPKEYIQRIVDGMSLKDGVMTIEVFVNKKGDIKASELGWRLPGCQATLNHSLSYGIDIYDILIDIAIGKKVTLKYKKQLSSVGDLYLPNKEGVVTRITQLEELLKIDGTINGEIYAEIGKYQKKRRVGNDASGWIQVEGVNENDSLKKMQYIYDNYIIETKKREEC